MEQSPPPGGGSNLSLAVEALEGGRVEQAIQLLQFATTMNPGSGDAHFHLGRAYLARENLTLAVASFRRAAELLPRHTPTLCALGKALAQQQSYEEARRIFESCLEADPLCHEARQALDLLPRPEDHLALANEIEIASTSTTLALDDGYRPRRLLFAVAGMGLFLVLLLGIAFVQMQQITSPAGLGSGAGTSRAAQQPSEEQTDDESGTAGGEKPGGGDSSAASGAAQPTPADEDDLKQTPYREVAAYLWRLYAAQQDYRAENGRYASLAELESVEVAEAGSASGQPMARYGNAAFNEDPPAADTFAIRAAIPDGTTLTIGEDGKIRKE